VAPFTHLLASWIAATSLTDDRRDCRLIALAGVVPDLDGLGLVADWINAGVWNRETHFYAMQHHFWLHGLAGGLVVAAALAFFGHQRWKVFLGAVAVYHLHLLCDLVGSRGPEKHDLWAIYYSGPFNHEWVWLWRDQWRLDGWQNTVITYALFAIALRMAVREGHSFVGVVSRRADVVFVAMLRRWSDRFRKPSSKLSSSSASAS
jgi:inner membrane protein